MPVFYKSLSAGQWGKEKGTAKLAPEDLNPTETLLWLSASLDNSLGVSSSQNLAFFLSLVSKTFDHTLLYCCLKYEGFPTFSEKQKPKQTQTYITFLLWKALKRDWKTNLSPITQSITRMSDPWTLLPSPLPGRHRSGQCWSKSEFISTQALHKWLKWHGILYSQEIYFSGSSIRATPEHYAHNFCRIQGLQSDAYWAAAIISNRQHKILLLTAAWCQP